MRTAGFKVLSSQSTGARRTRFAIAGALLVAATLAAYWPLHLNGFINFDDPDYVSDNRWVLRGITMEGMRWALTTFHAANWHPLTWLSHMLDVELFGLDPAGHHLHGLLLHLANALLVFGLFHRLTGALWRSAAVAALFALHPLHVESVAWVAERKDLLSTFFGLLSLSAYAVYARRPRNLPYLLTLGLFALALMSKPMVVTLPFVMLLIDFWPMRRWSFASGGPSPEFTGGPPKLRFLIIEKLPFFALAAGSCIITVLAQRSAGAIPSFAELGFTDRLGNALFSYWAYIGKTLVPMNLAVFYPLNAPPPIWQAALMGVGLCLLSALALRWAAMRPYFFTGWFWYLGTLVPVIGLVQVGSQAMADRYTYLPLIGVFILAVWGIAEISSRHIHLRQGLAAAGLLVIGLYAVGTFHQVQNWRSSRLLFQHAIETASGNFMAHDSLGRALYEEGLVEEAAEHYRRALLLRPRLHETHSNLGLVLSRLGRSEEAEFHLREALRIKPDFKEALTNLGMVLADRGDTEEAGKLYLRALAIDPNHDKALYNLGVLLARSGDYPAAEARFKEALRVSPDYIEARNNLANALAAQNRLPEAAHHYRLALARQPEAARIHFNLGTVLGLQGAYADALDHLRKARRLQPDWPEIAFRLAQTYTLAGDPDSAQREYEFLRQLESPLAGAYVEWRQKRSLNGRPPAQGQ